MFAIGFGLILFALIFAIMWGRPGRTFNWADHVAQVGLIIGTVLCAASLVMWVWKVLP